MNLTDTTEVAKKGNMMFSCIGNRPFVYDFLDSYLGNILSFGDPLISYFDSWVTEGFSEVSRVQAH